MAAILLAACGLIPATVAAASAAPVLETDTGRATAGYFRLHWEAATPEVRLERAPTAAFDGPQTEYEGPDDARVLSGQPDGISHLRIAALEDGRPVAWSEAVAVTVEHHPLSRAFLFFGIGGVVFLSTLALIVHGARKDES